MITSLLEASSIKKKTKKYQLILDELEKIDNLHSIVPETLKDKLIGVNVKDRELLTRSLTNHWVRNVCDSRVGVTSLLNWVWALKGRVRFWVCMVQQPQSGLGHAERVVFRCRERFLEVGVGM